MSMLDVLRDPTITDTLIGPRSRVHSMSCACFECQIVKQMFKNAPRSDFFLELEMAGTKRENIKVKIRGQRLEVVWENRHGAKDSVGYPLSEKMYDHSTVECKYQDGLLTVKVKALQPKNETPPPEKETSIDIK